MANNQTGDRAMRTIRVNTIRVKKENQTAVVDALLNAGFEAKPSKITPLNQWESDWNSDHDFEDWTFQSLIGMSGIETTASGNEAHKIIKSLKAAGIIQ